MAIFNAKEIEILKKENTELKKQLESFTSKADLYENLEDILKRLRNDISELNEQKQTLCDEIQILKNDKNIKESELQELTNKIPELNGYKNEIQQSLIEYTRQIEILKKDIDNARKNSSLKNPDTAAEYTGKMKLLQQENQGFRKEIRQLNDKINELLKLNSENRQESGSEGKILEELKTREVRLLQGIENKKAEADFLIKKVENLKKRDLDERENLKNIYKLIEEKKRERDYYSKDEIRILNNVAGLKEKEDKLSNEILRKEKEIKTQDEILNMLTKNIAHKQEKEDELNKDLRELDNELRLKTNSIQKISEDYNKIFQENNSGQKTLNDIKKELEEESPKLFKLNDELSLLKTKLFDLEKEIEKSELIKKEQSQKITEQAEIYGKLKEQIDLMQQTLPLLEKKKTEIEKENASFEDKFGKVFQKYSKDVNELSRKRIVYEKLVMDKEKEINEKDQMLFEKIAALEESERVLGLRQAEINSLQGTLKVLEEQKEILKQDLITLENKTTEVLRRNDGLRMETEYLMSKKQSIEDGMKEILNDMNDRFEKARLKKHDIDEEIAEYEDRLHITRERISGSIKELSELQTSVGQLKLQHEEQRGFITKLVAKKTKLQEEISKNEMLLHKYKQIKEKVELEKIAVPVNKEGETFPGEEAINQINNGKSSEQQH